MRSSFLTPATPEGFAAGDPARRSTIRSGPQAIGRARAWPGRDEIQLRGLSRIARAQAYAGSSEAADGAGGAGASRDDAPRDSRPTRNITATRTTPIGDGRGLRRAAVRRTDRPICSANRRSALIIERSLAPLAGRRVLDVGTGTGRAAIGPRTSRRDASPASMRRSEMLRVARRARARRARTRSTFGRGDAHASAVRRSPFDAVVCLRVLMHTPDWRESLAELCRVARGRVVIDYPALAQRRRPSSRRRAGGAGRRPVRVEAYRVFADESVSDVLARAGFRVVDRHRQFVLPIALHKRLGSAARHRARSRVPSPARAAAPGRLAGDDGGGAVSVLVTGATGFTGGHLARALARRGDTVRALVRDEGRALTLRDSGVDARRRRPHDTASLDRATRRRRRRLQHRRALSRGRSSRRRPTAASTRRGRRAHRGGRTAGVRRVVHCSTVGVHGDIEHPPANEDAPLRPGDVYQETKLEGEQVARRASAESASKLVIARPTGIYGPGDRRLLKLFRGIARRRFVMLGRAGSTTTSPTSTISSKASACAAKCRPPRAHLHPGGGEVTTLDELVARIASQAGVAPVPWPAGVAVLAGRCAARGCARRSASRRRSTGAASTSSPRAARSTSRGRGRSWDSRRPSA